ncbi:MAG: hypothetical protein ILP10_05760, partial [Lachnospiraceae bacterium]|nr:hypothetical protein [Lachnospiraceae bacterium]
MTDKTFCPAQIGDALLNPYMGWVPMATKVGHKQPHTMVYAPLIWSQLEPEERGRFDWDGFEDRCNFKHWKEYGVRINIRFYMDQPTMKPHMDIPKWLYEMLGGDGDVPAGTSPMPDTYKGEPYDSCIGVGYTPNYADPVLIREHERVVEAIAKRYGEDPSIAFIQIGSLGHWGEWHCWPYTKEEGGPSGTFPRTDIADIYVSHYLKNFDRRKLCMRRPTGPAASNGLGLFNDMFGDVPASKEVGNAWYEWFKKGYRDARGEEMPAMPDFWKRGVSGGEFANGNAGM